MRQKCKQITLKMDCKYVHLFNFIFFSVIFSVLRLCVYDYMSSVGVVVYLSLIITTIKHQQPQKDGVEKLSSNKCYCFCHLNENLN